MIRDDYLVNRLHAHGQDGFLHDDQETYHISNIQKLIKLMNLIADRSLTIKPRNKS